MASPRLRFAPSPTGYLHCGNARTALLNTLYARKHKGWFLLRLDDTDASRSRPEYAEAIKEDLLWLSIAPDEVLAQSARRALYEHAAETLKSSGLLYPCYETPEELKFRRARARAAGKPPVYDRAALSLTGAERAALEAEGHSPHWRFRLSGAQERFTDIIHGACQVDTGSLSDPVLIRADGQFLYTLPSVVDDLDCAISHVVRGEDHLTNTAVHIQLARALGGEPPVFAHHPLLLDESGEGLSKRKDGLSLRALREEGIEPMAINNFLAELGGSADSGLARDIDALAARFDLAGLSRNPARFDKARLVKFSADFLRGLDYRAARPRLAALGVRDDEAFWQAVRGNLARLEDVRRWEKIIAGEMTPVIEDPALIAEAERLLPASPWDGEVWQDWTKRLAAQTGKKGKDLFLPLRLALTGLAHGPEMKNLLYLIGRKEAARRLRADAKR